MNRSVQWLNENRHRSYPIVEDDAPTFAGPGDVVVTLPTDFILDFQFTSNPLRDGTMELVQLTLDPSTAELTFRYTERGTTATLDFAVTVPANPAVPYRALITNSDYDINVVFGEGVATVLAYAAGVYAATQKVELEPSLLAFQGYHRVESLIGDTDESVPVWGDVYFEEGYNVVIRVNTLSQSIVIGAAQGAGAGWPCEPLDPDRPTCGQLLLRINGVYASPEGVIQLLGSNGISIVSYPDIHEIVIQTRTMIGEINCKANN